ncbi:MAG: alpha/beta hydrolase [Clostridia bacterium]|nr:alpha/beta hydrolase [Clostridia bacterium]
MSEKKRGKGMFVFICILVFIISFAIGVVTKMTIKPAWSKKYSIEWSDEIGTLVSDISYGEKDSNKFDLYFPKDNSKANYGLVVYLHAGGFTMGDKSDDKSTLAWLCSKGYVACGINYTLRDETNNASVYTQSMEIKQAMPVVIEEAKKLGYNINEMTISGGSAGGCLAMLYAYRDSEESPVPLKMLFEMVGPSSFYVEDWGIYGLDRDTDQAREAAVSLFGAMSGAELTKDMIKDGSYQEYMQPISAYSFVNENSVPSVLLYGEKDKMQPYNGVRHLEKALKDNGVDYKLFVAPHSGHGVQNDDAVMEEFMETVDEYLEKYMPVQ